MATTSDTSFRTTFLVPNLHCPSCVTNIEGAVYGLSPKPTSISHSIITRTITINHPITLPVALICTALENAGYDVDSVHADPRSVELYSFEALSGKGKNAFSDASPGWKLRHLKSLVVDGPEQNRKRKRHIENCDLCRTKEYQALDGEANLKIGTQRVSSDSSRTGEYDINPDAEKVSHSGETHDQLVVTTSEPTKKTFEAELSIEGMTCTSCINGITKALEEKPWILSVSINLLSHSGTVKFHGEHGADAIVEAIEDVGFEAAVQRVTEVISPKTGPEQRGKVWKAIFAIGGMTCSSCSSTITSALKDISWIQKAEVNLVGNSATIVFDGKDHLNEIKTKIEDIGYEATLDNIVDVSLDARKDTRRSVAIIIDGMYCEHCPARVAAVLQQYDSRITTEKLPTVTHPILKISYMPKPPSITIRNVLKSIAEADPAFGPSIYHPLTIEERSRMMQAREQKHILARVILAILAAIPTFIIGIVFMDLVPAEDARRQYLMEKQQGVNRAEWALFIIATPVYFFAADLFHRRTLKEVRALWRPGNPVPIYRRFIRFGSMNMLVSLGTSIAYWSSIAILIVSATRSETNLDDTNDFYFDSVVFLTMFLLIGRMIEAYSKAKAGDAVVMLGKLRPTEALLVLQDSGANEGDPKSGIEKIGVDLLEYGDSVRVPQGSSPPCDGMILEGESKFDESSLTGEARLVTKVAGDSVYAGTINQGNAISIRITGVAGASMLDQIMKVVREGQARRAPVERLADIITGHFVPIVTLVAIITWIIWLALGVSGTLPDSYLDIKIGGWPYWSLQFAIAVFVVACPCGIGLAAPTALFVGGSLAAKHGILVKGGGEAFQEASKLDCVVFDKTGTLTMGGEPAVTNHELLIPHYANETDLLNMMKSLEEDSGHPIAKAVVAFCQSRGAMSIPLKQSSEVAGRGMHGSFSNTPDQYNTMEMLIGNENLMANYSVHIPTATSATLHTWKSAAKSIILVATRSNHSSSTSPPSPWTLAATLATSDPIRPEAPAVLAALRNRSLSLWLLTGDNPTTAHAVGATLGIPASNIIAGVLPADKASQIRYLQRSQPGRGGRRALVAMVGDGINDAPALAAADVAVAMGCGADVAVSAAAFVLVAGRLDGLPVLLDLSRAVLRRIKFNFAWALVYNLVGLPVAAGVLYPVVVRGGGHVRLDPVWAALAMALSSVSVVGSSLALRSGLPFVGFRTGRMMDRGPRTRAG